MATIRQRGKRWQCIVKRKGHPLLSQTFDSRRDAEKWARHQESMMDMGRWCDRSLADQTNLGTLLDRYAKEISVTKRGVEIEAIRIRCMKRSKLAQCSVGAISGQKIAEWRDQRLKEVCGSTVSRELQLLSHVFNIAIKEWGFNLPYNPVLYVRRPPQAKPRNRVLTKSERQALLESCEKCRNPWIKPIVIFALETACRRSEILTLSWEDISLDTCTATVSGKTGARRVPLSPAITSLLCNLPEQSSGRVFPISVECLKQAYERAIKRAGISNFTFHDLRHEALTSLASKGLSILELRAISGHCSANMLQRYVSISAEDLAKKLASPEPEIG